MNNFILEIAVFVPLNKNFDYQPLLNSKHSDYFSGQRVLVPFGKRKIIGVVLELKERSNVTQLKKIDAIIDTTLAIPPLLFKLCKFAHQYYHYPLGEVLPLCFLNDYLHTTAPKLISLNVTCDVINEKLQKKSPTQYNLLNTLSAHDAGLSLNTLLKMGFHLNTIQSLAKKNWLSIAPLICNNKPAAALASPYKLSSAQQAAIAAIINPVNLKPILLHGITGSGKTEVYLNAIAHYLKLGQVLVLLPEISLTPQTAARFEERFLDQVVILHSKVALNHRKEIWSRIANSKNLIIIGTRSALFAPIPLVSLIIIDEEHDQSFKQQSGLLYSARDLAIMYAHLYKIPIVLGSATPSLESYANAQNQRYQLLELHERATGALLPNINLVDLKSHKTKYLAPATLKAIRQHLEQKQQVLVFINRRGYAPTLFCKSCKHIFQCTDCSVNLVVHLQQKMLMCHHCAKRFPLASNCNSCGSDDLISLGAGTEKLEDLLGEHFKDISILRIDSDSTRKKDSLRDMLSQIAKNPQQLIIGTQILAKGHHFPNLSLVVILGIDGFLYSSDFRATEHAMQLLMQVAGRAGRDKIHGEVIIESMHPEHEVFKFMRTHDYAQFAQQELAKRQQYQLPPFSSHALLRAKSTQQPVLIDFLKEVAALGMQIATPNISILGPVAATMLRKENYYHWQLLMQAPTKALLQNFLQQLLANINNLPLARKVRFTLDVDPQSV